MTDGTERAQYSEGGDPVCWLDRVCEECGAFRETAGPNCARCGTPFPGAGPSDASEPPGLPSETAPITGQAAPPPSHGTAPPSGQDAR